MNIIKSIIFSTLFIVSSALALEPVYSTYFGNKAINGYDPVAYFTEKKAVEGREQFTYQYQGANWYFSSEENLAKFKAQPTQYAPQYGGYCAYAVSQGATASTDPHAWTIHEGKLYLNYSQSVRQKWRQDIPGNVTKGNKNWPILLSE